MLCPTYRECPTIGHLKPSGEEWIFEGRRQLTQRLLWAKLGTICGFEPARRFRQRILSPRRLPFRHGRLGPA